MKTTTLTVSELKNIISISENYGIDKKELLENIESENIDFEIDNYRFILESEAENILVDMYSCDEYVLGSFNAWFIADNCEIDIDVVEALQEAEKFEILGKLMLKNGIEDLICEYIRLDGYGNAFLSYDGNNDEVTINDNLYIIFRTN